MPHVLIKYAHMLICISVGEGSRHFSAFHFSCNHCDNYDSCNQVVTYYIGHYIIVTSVAHTIYGIKFMTGAIAIASITSLARVLVV